MQRGPIVVGLGLLAACTAGFSPAHGTPWTVGASAFDTSGGKPDVELQSVTALAADDAWAVGASGTILKQLHAHAQHWDGARWTAARLPLPEDAFSYLTSVDGVASDDVWAVGLAPSNGGTLALHWNGKRWSWSKTPSRRGSLRSVTAHATDDVWAVGDTGRSTLTEHFDGTRWQRVASPDDRNQDTSTLQGVSEVDAHDVWAAGYASSEGHQVTLAEHWDGMRWTKVAAVNPASRGNSFSAVSAVSTGDVWAVGTTYDELGYAEALIEHWDGESWRVFDLPDMPTSFLTSVSARSADDVWAVGAVKTNQNPYTLDPLVEHWNGSSWTQVDAQGGRGNRDAFDGVSARAGDNAWAVGHAGDNYSLIRHWDGTAWS